MSYLDKAKGVAVKEPVKPKESTTYERNEITNKASQTAQTVLNPVRNNSPETAPSGVALPVKPGTLPCLGWQLERLISAASADALPKGTVTLPSGFVPDLNRYVLGWAASYLVSDRIEAEKRLWEAYRAWQGVN